MRRTTETPEVFSMRASRLSRIMTTSKLFHLWEERVELGISVLAASEWMGHLLVHTKGFNGIRNIIRALQALGTIQRRASERVGACP
jgi:hypothetical protein